MYVCVCVSITSKSSDSQPLFFVAAHKEKDILKIVARFPEKCLQF